MTLNQFIKKYRNTSPDFDGVYPGQCVDLYRLYCKEVLQVPQSPPVVGAKDIWGTYLPAYFDRIPNRLWAVPKKGDVVIFRAFSGNPYGHVGIVIDGSWWSFTSFDSNWSVPRKARLEHHNYKLVIGWLRPKQQQSPTKLIDRVNEALRECGDDPARSVGTLNLSKWWQNRVASDPQKFTNDNAGYSALIGAIRWHQANKRYPHDNT